MTRRISAPLYGTLLVLGCSGGGSGPDPNSPTLTKATPSGDGQTGPSGTTLPDPLRVMVALNGTPVAGRTVTWAVLASGGFANPPSSVSGGDGIATTSVTLPPFAATIAVTAASSGASGSARFILTSTGATSLVTVLVADNEFRPENVQVQAGGTVTFEWVPGAGPHNVAPVSPNTIPASNNPPPPATHNAPYLFETRFPTLGTFVYFCEVHGTPNSGMRGAVTVVP